MTREIDASKAIHKLREAQLILREVRDKCIQVGFQETDKIVRDIQEIKDRLFLSTPIGAKLELAV